MTLAPATGSAVPDAPAETLDSLIRLSELRNKALDNGTLEARAQRLWKAADELGALRGKELRENDISAIGKPKPASAFKRKPFPQPDGSVYWRTDRPKFREALDRIRTYASNGFIAEHVDRMCRDERDCEDLLEIVHFTGASVYSLDEYGRVGFRLTRGGTDDERSEFRNKVKHANDSSRDTGRRITVAHQEQAMTGRSNGGRLRAYGWEADRKTPVPDEQDVIRWAAGVVLAEGKDGMGWRGVARQLNIDQKPTVTGVPWTAQRVKQMLLRHRNAGIAAFSRKERHPDPAKAAQGKTVWVTEEIGWLGEPPEWARNAPLSADVFRALQGKAARQAAEAKAGGNVTGNAPKWLLSYLGLCGPCDRTRPVQHKRVNYMCSSNDRQHPELSVNADAADALVSEWAVSILERPEAAGLLAKPAAARVDTARLYAQKGEQKRKRQKAIDDNNADPGIVTDEDRNRLVRKADSEIAKIDKQIAAAMAVMEDPLAGIAGQENARELWDAMTGPAGLIRRRAIIDAIMTVTFLQTDRYKQGFDPSKIVVEPKQPGVVPWIPPKLDEAELKRIARGKPVHADRIADWLAEQAGPRTADEIAAALGNSANNLAQPMLDAVADGRVTREWVPGTRTGGGRYLYRATEPVRQTERTHQ